jgi:DNA-binding transcriptional ArsR family regulator
MTAPTPKARTSIVVDNNDPVLIDAGEAIDDVYGALADERRRRILYVLSQKSRSMSVESLASKVADQESSGQAAEEAEERVHISLCHQHLPKLNEADLISYDRDAGTVEKSFREVETLSA